MGFYDEPTNVDRYIDMCKDYDGSNIYRELAEHLVDGKTVLELGSGAGLDMPFLTEHYQVTGSDLSKEFLSRCVQKFPDTLFIQLNAVTVNINDQFDCIYSNKVLHHLTEDELVESLNNQAKHLNPDGIIAHSFWIGHKLDIENKEMFGLRFNYYKIEYLLKLISCRFKVLSSLNYTEFDENDSLFVIAQKR